MPLTLDQMARRRAGVGSSEVAAVVGLSKWAGPIDVWQAKTQPQQPHAATPATQRGDFLEPALREWYAFVHDRQVQLCDTLQHPDHEIVLATPDGISTLPAGADPVLLEIKSPGPRTQRDWGDDGTDHIPLYYLPQVTWALAVTRLPRAHVVALIYGELRVYQVPYEPALFDALLEKVSHFWRAYVQKRVPPPVDESKSFAEYLARKFRRVQQDAAVVRGTQVDRWAKRLARARRDERLAQARAELARNHIKELMGEATEAETAYGTCTWRARKGRQMVNWPAIAEELNIPAEVVARHTQRSADTRAFCEELHLPETEAPQPQAKD